MMLHDSYFRTIRDVYDCRGIPPSRPPSLTRGSKQMSSCETPPNVVTTAGPMFVGYVVNWILFGVLSVQVYSYYIAFPNDRKFTKLIVYGVYSLEVTQTIMATDGAFIDFARKFGDVEELSKLRLVWFYLPIIGGLIASIGQIFYAYRIRVISRARVVPLVVVSISLLQCAAAFMTGVITVITGTAPSRTSNGLTFVTTIVIILWLHLVHAPSLIIITGYYPQVWLVSVATCDILIAVLMTYYLSREDIIFARARVLVRRVVRLSIETGTLTAAVMLLGMVILLAFPNNIYYVALAFTFTKWYSNTILVILNSRMIVVGGREQPPPSHVLSSLGWLSTTQPVIWTHEESRSAVTNPGAIEPATIQPAVRRHMRHLGGLDTNSAHLQGNSHV